MRGERFKKIHRAVPQILAKAIKIENLPKTAHRAMLGRKVVLNIAKEKVNKTLMVYKHDIK